MGTQDEQLNKSGFEILRDYFSKLEPSDSLLKDKYNNNVVDMSWFFTEDLRREVIQKTIARLMKESNGKYEDKCLMNRKKPEDISDVTIKLQPDCTSLMFQGADKWTKLKITDRSTPSDQSSIPTINIEKFEKEICKTIIEEKNPDYTPFLKGIHTTLNDACKNLVNYYKYLIEQKKEHTTFSCLISPETTNSSRHARTSEKDTTATSYKRKNPEIPFTERSKILDQHKPLCIVNVSQKKANGDIMPNAYMTYVYNNVLSAIPENKNKGYLFVSEPLSGTKHTQLYFVSDKEFKKEAGSSGFKFEKAVKKHLEMPIDEFIENGNILLDHTTLESYTDKINLYIDGEKGKNNNNPKISQTKLQSLYHDKSLQLPNYTPRISKNTIAQIGLENSTGYIDRTAQQYLARNEQHPTMDISD